MENNEQPEGFNSEQFVGKDDFIRISAADLRLEIIDQLTDKVFLIVKHEKLTEGLKKQAIKEELANCLYMLLLI